jgi:uridylate kinase
MYIHLKQSGELLAAQRECKDGEIELWTPNGVRTTADKLKDIFADKDKHDIDGFLAVSGAGNIVRGDRLEKSQIGGNWRDVLGRLAIIQNTIVLAEALDHRRVPYRAFVADTMRFEDGSLPKGFFEPYDVDTVFEAYDHERIVLIAGGTGEDGLTTDNAVIEYARRHQVARPDDTNKIVVLKGTKHDGVFEEDPEKHAHARKYSRISAITMRRNYERFDVVDTGCLDQIIATGITMRIYQDGRHDISSVVGKDNGHIGTLVVAEDIEPELAA